MYAVPNFLNGITYFAFEAGVHYKITKLQKVSKRDNSPLIDNKIKSKKTGQI